MRDITTQTTPTVMTMRFSILLLFIFFSFSFLKAQVNYSANDQVLPYTNGFRLGVNSGVYPGFTDEDLATLAAGNPEIGNKGVGVKAIRPALFESFTNFWGTDIRVPTFQYYYDLDIKDNTVIVGFPAAEHQDPNFYCEAVQSQLFANMYEPIWDNGENGTPYNDDNYYAAYLWEVVNSYQDYVKFWEIWNEPGFDYTGATGFLPPGQEGNWWENNPDPCDYKLRAPIFHYVRLLRISWEVIKSIDETAYVTVSGTGYPAFLDAILRNTDNPEDGSVTEDYPLKGGAYFDVCGYHSYPHFDGSLREYSNEINDFIYYRHSDAAAEGINRSRVLFQDVLDNYGYDGTTHPEKLWTITECNLPRVAFGEYIGSTEAQRNFMPKAYFECVKNDFVQLDIYKIAEDKTDAEANYEFDLMGLYYKLAPTEMFFNEPNQAGVALRTTSRLLHGKHYDPMRSAMMNIPDDAKGGAFVDDYGNYIYILWAKTTIDQSEQAAATYSFPSSWNISNLIKLQWDYGETSAVEDIFAQNIPLNATPIFIIEQAFTADNYVGCAPLNVQLNAMNNAQVTTWTWTATNGNETLTNSGQNPQITLTEAGEYAVKLQAYTSTDILIFEQTQNITVLEQSVATFNAEVNGPIVNFNNTSTINSLDFFWDFGDGNISGDVNPIHLYTESGTYEVTLTSYNECGSTTYTQIVTPNIPSLYLTNTSAHDFVPAFDSPFRVGYNFQYYPNFTDEQIGSLAAGDVAENIKGIGATTLRSKIGEFFVNFWGYDVRLDAFQHYQNLGLSDGTMLLDFPEANHIDSTEYCPGSNSQLFKNLYNEIWLQQGEEYVINPDNPFAVYVYNMVQTYGDYIKYWEIINGPDFDLTNETAYLPPGEPNNWWENNPDPCDYQLRAPIYHYIRTLRIAYEVIKHLQPNDYVALSGIGHPSFLDVVLRNTDNPLDGSSIAGYEKTGGAYFDVLGYKSYPHFDGTTSYYDVNIGGFAYNRHSDAAAEGILLSKNRFQEVLYDNGYDGTTYPEKEWIIVEANVPRFMIDEYMGGEEVQRNWIIKAYIEAVKQDIRQFNINSISETAYGGNALTSFDAMGLYQRLDDVAPGDEIVNNEGIALRTASQLLFGRSYDAAKTTQMNMPNTVNGAAFKDENNEYVYVLWAKTDTDKSEANTATYSFPTNWNMNDLYRRAWDFGETEETTNIEATNIALTAAPIFLTENQTVLDAPLAVFQVDTTQGCPSFEVQYTNNSIGEQMTYFWEFEGGTPATSTETNPTVTYNEIGIFDVKLTAFNNVGAHTMVLNNYIQALAPPTADFDFTVQGSWVYFENTTINGYNYVWSFGDNSEGLEYNPEHFYIANGAYDVRLIVNNACGSDTITQPVLIGSAPVVGFEYEVMYNDDCSEGTVTFDPQMYNNPTAWLWNFEGGTPATSTQPYPTEVIFAPGTHTISVTSSNNFGTTTTYKDIYVAGNVSQQISGQICENDSIYIGNTLINAANNSDTILLQTTEGCDSTLFVDYEIVDGYETYLTEIIEMGETYTVVDMTYNATGQYTDTLQSSNQCDSIVYLDLTVLTTTKDISVNEFSAAVMPNPFTQSFHLVFDINEVTEMDIFLSDIHGRTVKTITTNQKFNTGKQNLNIKTQYLPVGVYFIHFKSKSVQTTIKVIKI